MGQAKLKQELLASSAVIAFVGALLMAQAWQAPEGTVKLFFIFTVPDYTGLVIFGIIAFLFILAMFLALASFVPYLQRWADPAVEHLSPVLSFLGLVAFMIGLTSTVPDLPLNQWWAQCLVLGGFVLTIFLLLRYFLVLIRTTD